MNLFQLVSKEILEKRCKGSNFFRLVTAFREHGHKHADVNPVAFDKNFDFSLNSQLDFKSYGFKENDTVQFQGLININKTEGTILEAMEFLKSVYNKQIAAEFMHLENEEEINWFSNRLEEVFFEKLANSEKLVLATDLLKSEALDNFLAVKYTGLKRYGGEGAESMMAFFREVFQLSIKDNIEQIVLAMPHRGRLNLLTGLLNFPPVKIFHKLKGNQDFSSQYQGTGDVLSHCISSTNFEHDKGSVHVTVLYNPSHLEAVNPVSMGKTRAKQMDNGDGNYNKNLRPSDKILNLQVHGDAALIGQGVNQECLALCQTPHFDIGGSIHLVVNNQIGFTTPSDRGRSSRYCTDIAKVISAPIIHVNGDYPESVLKASRMVFEYQRKFRKDIFLDINCYRQWGHNELDDPTFTNPSLYNIIRSKRTVPDRYAEKLINEDVLSKEDKNDVIKRHADWLNKDFKASDNYNPPNDLFQKQWANFVQAEEVVTTWDTGVHLDLLTYVGSKSVKFPKEFNIHPTLLKSHVKNRLTKVGEGLNIDWATAETLAFGSLLYEGYNVRISGQDVGRGTFSHRHVMLVDQKTNNIFIPLNSLQSSQKAFLEVANSILSEEAVLGYEYGMSVESPKNLIVWEAQFGDFFNGAQIIFDTFISSGEDKWLWNSGLTVLLPHGYDGAGPEHSSSRIERFLQLTNSKEDSVDGDNINMQVCQPSTPAQYFHLLRRQMVRNFRKPLIIIAPKTLLRLPAATSDFSAMATGTTFIPVLGDKTCDPNKVTKILITAGKHYYSLFDKRESLGIADTAIIRLESFCPFPTMELMREVSKYPNVKVVVWCQEEPQNMGAWNFVKRRFENLIGKKIQYCGRETSAAPAVGIAKVHLQQVNDIVTKPFLTNF